MPKVTARKITASKITARKIAARPVYRGGASGGGIPLLVVQDEFTNDTASDVNLENHTPDTDYVGGGWVRSISGSGASQVKPDDWLNMAGLNNLYTIDCGQTAFTVQSYYIAGFDNQDQSIVFRYVDANNYWFALSRADVSDLLLYEVNSGTTTLRASNSSVTNDRWLKWWVEDDGSTIRVGTSLDNVVLSHSSALHAGSSLVGYQDPARTSGSGGNNVDQFDVISVADYTQLP